MMCSLVVILLLSISSSVAHGGGAGRQRYHVVATSHMEPKSFCSGLKVVPSAEGTWVPLHRPFGPCSPSAGRAPAPSLLEMLRWDQVRTEYVRRKASGGAEDVLNPAKPHVLMTQVDFGPSSTFGYGSGSGSSAWINADGDPAVVSQQTMAIDTTVDVPWIQCAPCPVPQCYPQRIPMFDPSTSSTAAAVRCGSPACRSLGSYGNGCSNTSANAECRYLIEYSDDRATAGTYMTDTLTISGSTAVRNFRFGCSHAVRGKFSDLTAGTMSLGGGAQSLLAQTARSLGNAFSYCVPPASASGFLSIGGPVTTNSTTAFATTPLVRSAINPSLYLVRLQGIVMAGRRLRIPPVVFSAGAVMDSSAVLCFEFRPRKTDFGREKRISAEFRPSRPGAESILGRNWSNLANLGQISVKFKSNFGPISAEIFKNGRNSAISALGEKNLKPKVKTQAPSSRSCRPPRTARCAGRSGTP